MPSMRQPAMTSRTAGTARSRPCSRLGAVAALTALAHGLLIALAWHGASVPKEPPRERRVMLRMIAAPVRAVATVVAAAAKVAPPVVARRAPAPAPVEVKPPPPPPAQAPVEAISGVTFALPRFG